MAYTWDNRIKYIVRFMYDIDNNGFLDKNDFICLAVRTTILDGKGEWSDSVMEKNLASMLALWTEIAELADFNKDEQVTAEEFKKAVMNACVGKKYAEFPNAMRAFIDTKFRTTDVNGDGLIGVEEYRMDSISRQAYGDVKEIDEAYENLINDEDRKKGGLDLVRYQELYADFLSNSKDCPAMYLFGPLTEL